MNKLFTSQLTETLDDLGCDGYYIDKDAIMRSLSARDPTSEAQERGKITKRYYYVTGKVTKRVYHKGDLFPRRGFIEALFDYARKANANLTTYESSWYCRWVDAHVNLILNRIYGSNKPEIDSFVMLNSGALDQLIIKLFGGVATHNDVENFRVALEVARNNIGDDLTKAEMALIHAKYFESTDDYLMMIKSELMNEIMTEWNAFEKMDMDELLKEVVV